MNADSTNRHAYERRRDAIVQQMKAIRNGENVRLEKDTSNLFRHYTEEDWIEVEGMAPYYNIIQESLSYGVMPAVVPQLLNTCS
ncbi:MAG TPA: hypothetical protein VLG69_04440 [Candidatus Andersenbacteria bacterium]|nr:hypothetical protein [Candidatus Andersenbacteria bacterium]